MRRVGLIISYNKRINENLRNGIAETHQVGQAQTGGVYTPRRVGDRVTGIPKKVLL